MTKYIFVFLMAVLSLAANAQNIKGLDKPLKTEEELKQAEPTARECAAYILSQPMNNEAKNAKKVNAFLLMWMTETKDYSFSVDGSIVKLLKKNEGLSMVIMAAMVKVIFDKPELNKDSDAMKLAAYKVLAEYCEDKKKEVKQTADVKKFISANKNGTLKEYLEKTK